MSRNFDYPPASSRHSRGSSVERQQGHSTGPARLRDLSSSQRTRDRAGHVNARAVEALSQEIEEIRHQERYSEETRSAIARQLQQPEDMTARRADSTRRRLSSDDRDQNSTAVVNPGIMDQESVGRQRRRAWRVSDLTRGRDGRMRTLPDLHGLLSLQPPPVSLRDRDPAISSMADDSMGHIRPLSPSLQNDHYVVETNRWRAKRRKLDSDDRREGLRGFSYGQYGQVVPGILKMEIVSCDGGTYSEPNGESSWPDNVLLNDSSVYCTKRDRCNLVLKHRGETPFCLKKIVIKAPKSGFDAPIQEGMIFVSMTSDELLARTAQYQIQHPTHRPRPRRSRRRGAHLSQEYPDTFRPPLQSLGRVTLTGPEEYSDSEIEPGTLAVIRPGPAELVRSTSGGSTPEFRVTTDFDDKSEDDDSDDDRPENDDDFPSAADMERMDFEQLEEELLCPDDEESESDVDYNEISAFRGRLELRRRMRGTRQLDNPDDNDLRRRRIPSLVEPVASTIPGNSSYTGSSRVPEVLKPHACFFIEREKSMVSIKFDTPPSGRFILIKLWSPYRGGNIDIQSIMVHGFAGPRFFPAGEYR
ncbi:hypothetical protein Egran_05287 [Elaphomyces granulatus]|uniref:Uncharacterized protein n=1 Tax=Elaphomyces granulatus TaxID=519963 RepID=A0A232LS11_9EURO|nr:hypothetical protein Egran_05287 [Elaphomyces granulatus]